MTVKRNRMKLSILGTALAALALLTVLRAPAMPARSIDGKAVFDSSCAACHGAGLPGAAKLNDQAARAATGKAALHAAAIEGKGAMPPRGGNAALSDAEVIAAVEYMISQAK